MHVLFLHFLLLRQWVHVTCNKDTEKKKKKVLPKKSTNSHGIRLCIQKHFDLYSFHLIFMNMHLVLARAIYRQAYLSFFWYQKMPNERESDRLRSVICFIPILNIPESSSAVLAFTSAISPFTKALTCSVLSKSPILYFEYYELNGKSQSSSSNPSLSSSLHLVLRLISSG